MLYIVECTYANPGSEEDWNEFYSREKLPALVSVTGFSTSQRFRALKPGCPVYLAIHTIKDADVISSDEYRLKGGGNFSRWQEHITDWHRNLYECEGPAPAVSSDELLLLSARPIGFIETGLGYRALAMQASGLDKSPERRVAYVLARENAAQLAEVPGAYLYETLTPQLQNPAKGHQRGKQ
ncbi:sugar ABC transporter [Sodalis sp. RH20]|uniref:sugar ABC transporter n=1 Tax=unclassified Sodalis (in: enterobacteria) TaxID=2636512 RepID=UPI0039B6E40A